jgi:trigger factor
MSVVVSLEDVGPWRKQLTVEVPAPAVEAETQRVVREYGQQARIPGFRRGKVPAEIVRRKFAKDIEREVVERLLPRYWHQAQAESEIDPLLPPEVQEVRDLEPGAPLTFVATVETRPTIELKSLTGFELPDPSLEPGIADVDDAIDDLRGRLGSWVATERSAARGDRVAAEITENPDDPAAATEPIEVEIGDARVWEELSLALSGLSAGQEATFNRHEAAVAHGDHEHPARDRKFRVKVREVRERELPTLDDDFAARVSPDYKTVYDLREAVTGRLREARTSDRLEQRQKALLDQLRERHPMELPQGVVQREVEMLVQDYAESLARGGVDVNRAGIEWNKVAEEMTPLGERRVHARLLLDAIAVAESLTVGEEEFERSLAALARAQNTSTPVLRRSLDENGRLAPFRAQLLRDKTLRRLLGEDETSSASPVL